MFGNLCLIEISVRFNAWTGCGTLRRYPTAPAPVDARLLLRLYFFCGFFGAGASVLAAGMSMVLLLWLTGVYDWYHLQHDYVRYLPLFVLPEGLVNGVVVTGLMVFRPELLTTLDERRYR